MLFLKENITCVRIFKLQILMASMVTIHYGIHRFILLLRNLPKSVSVISPLFIDIRIPLMWKDSDHFSNKERMYNLNLKLKIIFSV